MNYSSSILVLALASVLCTPVPGGVISSILDAIPEVEIMGAEMGHESASYSNRASPLVDGVVSQLEAEKSAHQRELKIAYNDHRLAMKRFRDNHHSIHYEQDVIRTEYQKDLAAEKLRHTFKNLRAAKQFQRNRS